MTISKKMKRIVAVQARRMDWEKSRLLSLGGAALSTATVFLIIQIGLHGCVLEFSFVCSSLAIPVWLALWQFGEIYQINGPASQAHFEKPAVFFLGLMLFLIGALLLFTSFVALIWEFSMYTSVAFIVVSVVMFLLIAKHQKNVDEYTKVSSLEEGDNCH